jgi:hypothetical protein
MKNFEGLGYSFRKKIKAPEEKNDGICNPEGNLSATRRRIKPKSRKNPGH